MAKRGFQPLSRGSSDKPVEVNTAGLPDLVEISLDDKDAEAFTVVEVDDTPDEDKGRPTRVDQPTEITEAELKSYGEKAQKRIGRLNFERETERRGREQAERIADTAVGDLQKAREEIERLKSGQNAAAAVLGNTMLERHKAALTNAQSELTAAIEAGDAAAQAKAQVAISTIAAEITAIQQRIPRQPAKAEGQPQAQQPQAQQPQSEQPRQPRLHPNVQAWIKHNESWFQQEGYQQRTNSAINIAEQLRAEGVPPGSAEYMKALDERMAVYYPDHQPFRVPADMPGAGGGQKDEGRSDTKAKSGRPNAGTEVTRENADTSVHGSADPRVVRLTSSELSIAKKLGVSPQAYAREKIKREAAMSGAQ